MLHISLRQLSYFVAAARHGSTLQAALALHVSQPSISHAIATLEAHWGEKLFHRIHAQGLELTTAGARRSALAQALLTQAQALDAPAGQGVAGSLCVAGLSTLAPMHLPALMRRFSQRFPQVELRLGEGDTETLLSRLERGTLDLALLYDMGLQRAVALHEVGAQAPYVLMPVGHALAKRASVALRDLADEPLVLIDLPHSRQYFLSLLAHAGVRPQVVMESGSLEMVRALVAHGHGLSLLTTRPSRDVSYDGRRLVCKPLSGKMPPQRLVLAASASVPLSPAAEAFVQVAREHLAAAG